MLCNCMRLVTGSTQLSMLPRPSLLYRLELEQLLRVQAGVEKLPNLRVLYASNNKLSSWADIEKVSQLPKLEELLLAGNPLYNDYRDRAALPEFRIEVLRLVIDVVIQQSCQTLLVEFVGQKSCWGCDGFRHPSSLAGWVGCSFVVTVMAAMPCKCRLFQCMLLLRPTTSQTILV